MNFVLRRTRIRRFKGQSLTELALALPLLLILIIGIIEVSRYVFIYSAVFNASREAARYGSASGKNVSGVIYYNDCAGIKNSAVRVSSLAKLVPGDVTITYDKGLDGSGNRISPTPCSGTAARALGDRIVVNVTKVFSPLVHLNNFPPLNITSTTARTIITKLDINSNPP